MIKLQFQDLKCALLLEAEEGSEENCCEHKRLGDTMQKQRNSCCNNITLKEDFKYATTPFITINSKLEKNFLKRLPVSCINKKLTKCYFTNVNIIASVNVLPAELETKKIAHNTYFNAFSTATEKKGDNRILPEEAANLCVDTAPNTFRRPHNSATDYVIHFKNYRYSSNCTKEENSINKNKIKTKQGKKTMAATTANATSRRSTWYQDRQRYHHQTPQQQQLLLNVIVVMLLLMLHVTNCHALLAAAYPKFGPSEVLGSITNNNNNNYNSSISNNNSNNGATRIGTKSVMGIAGGGSGSTSNAATGNTSLSPSLSGPASGGSNRQYMDILENLERSVAAVIIKVAYGTTSTTKRSIPDNSYMPSLTTIATPPLTTLRYVEKTAHQQQINWHHRNYELDLERDHALPTSAPNADILKSNSNPIYPNPNRHHNSERERHRHILNSSPAPSLSKTFNKKDSGPAVVGLPTYASGDMPLYSPPARSFFTPPLPPEYQNPFADKPTLRGTNNEGVVANPGTYINRRPIPPPSLMPGHERIPYRPPDLTGNTFSAPPGSMLPTTLVNNGVVPLATGINSIGTVHGTGSYDSERKKTLNTPSRTNGGTAKQEATTQFGQSGGGSHSGGAAISSADNHHSTGSSHNARQQQQEVLPSIRRILSGSYGNKGEIPAVLLKQVTTRPMVNYQQPPSSPVVLTDTDDNSSSTSQENTSEISYAGSIATSNINKSKANRKENTLLIGGGNTDNEGTETGAVAANSPKMKMSTQVTELPYGNGNSVVQHINDIFKTTPTAVAAVSEVAAATSTTTMTTANTENAKNATIANSSASSRAATAHATWTVAWNTHVYLSVILFTILGVYTFYKILTYNKLTHLFSQSYFICIHLILIIICMMRIFYLCYDAYNIHSTFHIFLSEILLNLPATFLTISFSVLILYLFLKSFNHKNNRYSALIRPLTIVVGCGVHVVLCITLHYVESYTMQNHQQHFYQQQQQQQQLYRRHHYQQSAPATFSPLNTVATLQTVSAAAAALTPPTPPRVLSLICQIIYIFICLSLGLLYLYIYRILKRILRTKSQNYIHGFHNLSYAIHITIATALLFVLLAALQIFGAISISITRPLISQATVAAEMDWLQWGYQFSLRLIEIAIITLLSWVAGLKASVGGSSGGGGGGGSGGGGAALDAVMGDGRRNVVGITTAADGIFMQPPLPGNASGGAREKHAHQHHYQHPLQQQQHHHNHQHHSNVAGFFLPCTSSSSQEQFDADYPAVCNANTNLHTYTMRTGKLIYDDSYALNALSANNGEFKLQPTSSSYQRPYDNGSSLGTNHNVDFAHSNHYYHHHHMQQQLKQHHHHHGQHQYGSDEYLSDDVTTDHYENPNFELRSGGGGNSSSLVSAGALQKLTPAPQHTSNTTSTSAVSCSGGSGASGSNSMTSQQQMLLLQSDSCYSEPIQPSSQQQQQQHYMANYKFNNFERPKFGAGASSTALHDDADSWTAATTTATQSTRNRDKKSCAHLERLAYENSERRSSNSTHSCSGSSVGGGSAARYASYNTFEFSGGGVRKSGTLNNIAGSGGGIIHKRNALSSPSTSPTSAPPPSSTDRQQQQLQQNQMKPHGGGVRNVFRGFAMATGHSEHAHDRNGDGEGEHELTKKKTSSEQIGGGGEQLLQLKQQQHRLHHNSDDDMMFAAGNAERTNLMGSGDDANNAESNPISDLPAIIGNGSEHLLPAKPLHFIAPPPPPQSPPFHAKTGNNKPQLINNFIKMSNGGCALESAASSSASNSLAESSTASADSPTSASMLVADHGFVHFRAVEDMPPPQQKQQ